MFNCLPGEDKPNGIVAPVAQSAKVDVCVFVCKGMANKGDIVAVEKSFSLVGRLVWYSGKFCVSSDIDAVDCYFTIMDITEAVAVNAKAKG